MDIENWIIKEQDRNIKNLQSEIEKMRISKEIKEHRLKEYLTELNYHINESLRLKDEIRKLLGIS